MPRTRPQRARLHRVFPFTALLAGLLLSVSGCDDSNQSQSAQKSTKYQTHWVEVYTVTPTTHALKRTRSGTISAQTVIDIYPQEEGQIRELPHHEGDQVRKDEVLLKLDDSLLQAQLARATALRQQVEMDLQRLKTLFAKQLAPADEVGLKETELAVARSDEAVLRTRLNFTTIRSPLNATVMARLAEPGSVAQKQTHVLTLANLDALVTEMEVSELLLSSIQVGMAVSLHIDALKQTVEGQVARIYPGIDARTRQGRVDIQFSNPGGRARPGQYVRGQFEFRIENAIFLPFRAVQKNDETLFVWMINENGKAERRTIQTGIQQGDHVEVVSGLSSGESVITRGFLDLKAGKSVTVVSHDD